MLKMQRKKRDAPELEPGAIDEKQNLVYAKWDQPTAHARFSTKITLFEK